MTLHLDYNLNQWIQVLLYESLISNSVYVTLLQLRAVFKIKLKVWIKFLI